MFHKRSQSSDIFRTSCARQEPSRTRLKRGARIVNLMHISVRCPFVLRLHSHEIEQRDEAGGEILG